MQTPPVQQMLTRSEGLATRLKRARGTMLAKDLAEQLHWPQSKISKIEGGKQLPSRDDLNMWAAATEADQATLESWHGMLTEAESARRDWLARVREGGHEAVQQSFSDLVQAADRLSFFETTFIPRFFQVPGYTRAVLTWANAELGLDGDVEAGVAARQADVSHLYSGKEFNMLIAEPVLYWRYQDMPVTVMRQQLDRLLTLDGLDNVRFGIIPMNAPAAVLPVHSFEIYGDVLVIETFYDEQRIEDEGKLAQYQRTLDRMWSGAATGDAATRLIHTAINALPRT